MEQFYIREQFGAYAFFNANNYERNFLSKVRNVLVSALNDHQHLPKLIVMVLENDLIQSIQHNNFGVSLEGGILLEWLINETYRIILTRKDQLKNKFKCPGEPHVIWIGLPLHVSFPDNDKRTKFNNSLRKIVPMFNKMSVMQPRKGWSTVDESMFQNDKFTAAGLLKYWKAIDSAIHFWDSKKTNTQIIQQGMQLLITANFEPGTTQDKSGEDQPQETNEVSESTRKKLNHLLEYFRQLKQCELEDRENRDRRFQPRRNNFAFSRRNWNRFHWRSNDRRNQKREFKLSTPPQAIKKRLTFD